MSLRSILRDAVVRYLDLNMRDIRGQVTSTQIGPCAVDTRHLARNAVLTRHLAPGAILRSHEESTTWREAEPPQKMTHWYGEPVDENGLTAKDREQPPAPPRWERS